MNSRIYNTRRNLVASYILMVAQIMFSFISRTAIVYTLGTDYLGLSSLFTSILQVLNIAESGFSSSVIYFMYKPIAAGDTRLVCALLNYLRKVYKVVGLVILFVGILVTPFIDYLIKGDVPNDINIYILYLLYLVNTSISYFLYAYKTSLLTAIQRLDLTKVANTITIVIQYGLQLIALFIFHSYYMFVIVMVLGTGCVNIFTAYISDKKYPEYKCEGEIDSAAKKNILQKVKGLLICNISGVTYNAFDSIIISAYIGLSSVAIYNNYYVIINTVSSFILLVRASMQASVANSVACETTEKNLNDLKLWQFLFSLIATLCTACLICLFQPLMKVWMGEHMLLPFVDVILLGMWFISGTVQQAFYLYLNAAGLWHELKWVYIFSTIFNLCMNILLGKLIGMTGIILASLLAGIVFGLFWQCTIILRQCFKIPSAEYIRQQFLYFVIAAFITIVTYTSCNLIIWEGIEGLIIKAVLSVVVATLLILLIYHRSPYFNRSKQIFLKIIHKQ
ncbi:O-antigen flippase Wzx [Anaerovibrio sp. JC8]|uniref:lipopolysaccharide biosynthesis protein n=1 Tax=Anaerovibrio sp. JC8 TaxID=1240085 RepID=UPI000A0CB232|nr:oligosaccharide flippase family protein [Anaerovibrio sp. JC8]ORU01435.1 O-antigen flippase Wzx [Anaerovibrio sp. JC8]